MARNDSAEAQRDRSRGRFVGIALAVLLLLALALVLIRGAASLYAAALGALNEFGDTPIVSEEYAPDPVETPTRPPAIDL